MVSGICICSPRSASYFTATLLYAGATLDSEPATIFRFVLAVTRGSTVASPWYTPDALYVHRLTDAGVLCADSCSISHMPSVCLRNSALANRIRSNTSKRFSPSSDDASRYTCRRKSCAVSILSSTHDVAVTMFSPYGKHSAMMDMSVRRVAKLLAGVASAYVGKAKPSRYVRSLAVICARYGNAPSSKLDRSSATVPVQNSTLSRYHCTEN